MQIVEVAVAERSHTSNVPVEQSKIHVLSEIGVRVNIFAFLSCHSVIFSCSSFFLNYTLFFTHSPFIV